MSVRREEGPPGTLPREPEPLPTPSGFERRMLVGSTLISAGGVLLVVLYLLALLQLSDGQWRAFLEATAVAFAVLNTATNLWDRRERAPVRRYLARRGEGGDPTAALEAAYRRAAALPHRAFLTGQISWGIGGLLVASGTALRSPEGLGLHPAAVMVAAALSAGFVSMIFHHFAVLRVTGPVARALARELDDPERVEALTPFLGLRAKLVGALTGVVGVVVLFAVFLAQDVSRRPVERHALGIQQRFLESARAEVARGGPEALRRAEASARRLGIAEQVFAVGAEPAAAAELPLLGARERRHLAGAGPSGTSEGLGAATLFAWVPLGEEGRRLVAASPREALLGAAVEGRRTTFGLLALLALGLAVAVAGVVAHEVARGTQRLRAEAERIAAGDLTAGLPAAGDDELGRLGRSFGRMAAALRATVQGVAEAADGLEGTARELATVSNSVSSVTADQTQGIERATHSMGAIQERVEGVTRSSESLNGSAEEASSAIVELGASGEELYGTASVLSGKVDEVTSSIEGMSASVEQVARSADDLSGAADETAASVEEMATSMRQVDSNAAETARLSASVVDAAERGREKVRLTIEGMEAIRGSTDAAEGVIRTLGDRSREIGAIVDVIDDVADETNLLALNAAIIAAQSGEHGRAFSVVADEIKELADRVLENTKEIASVVRGLQKESENATAAIAEGAGKVQSGAELSAEAGVALEEITRAARESGQRIDGIVSAVREQTDASGHVAKLMERVREGVEQIRSAGQQHRQGNDAVARSAEEMRNVAQQVDGTTREQARGTSSIGRTVETVRETVVSIHGSLKEQSAACRDATDFLQRVDERTRANDESVSRLGEATERLLSQAGTLRASVRRFQL